MTNDELEESEFPKIWDNTMRTTGTPSCVRKLYWFLRGYDYADTPNFFAWGRAWHEMQRIWHTAPAEAKATEADALFVAGEAIAAGQNLWDEEGAEDSGNTRRSSLETIFDAYVEEFPSEPWKVVEGGDERGWVWPIEGTPYFLAGAIDLYIDWPGYKIIPLENKTSGSYLGDSYISQWTFSTQISQYIWGASQTRGEKVFGCLVNMATKNIPGPKSNWKTPRFVRSLETRSDYQLKEFIQTILWDIEYFKECWNNWFFPKTSDQVNCSGGVGKSPCLFKPVCLVDAPPEEVDPLNFHGITLRKEAWEPWKRKAEV